MKENWIKIPEQTKHKAYVYLNSLQILRNIAERDEHLALKVAIGTLEAAFLGDTTFTDPDVLERISGSMVMGKINNKRYEEKVTENKEITISKKHYDRIAQLYLDGFTQEDIATVLNQELDENEPSFNQQKISRALTQIKLNYPELLGETKNNTVDECKNEKSDTDTHDDYIEELRALGIIEDIEDKETKNNKSFTEKRTATVPFPSLHRVLKLDENCN